MVMWWFCDGCIAAMLRLRYFYVTVMLWLRYGYVSVLLWLRCNCVVALRLFSSCGCSKVTFQLCFGCLTVISRFCNGYGMGMLRVLQGYVAFTSWLRLRYNYGIDTLPLRFAHPPPRSRSVFSTRTLFFFRFFFRTKTWRPLCCPTTGPMLTARGCTG